MQTAQADTFTVVNEQLKEAGMPTYSELVGLLNEAQRLGLTFDCGSAYIRRAYIDTQTELNNRIKAVNEVVAVKHTAAA